MCFLPCLTGICSGITALDFVLSVSFGSIFGENLSFDFLAPAGWPFQVKIGELQLLPIS